MWTRAGKPINSCPIFLNPLKAFMERNPNMVIDGELYNPRTKSRL